MFEFRLLFEGDKQAKVDDSALNALRINLSLGDQLAVVSKADLQSTLFIFRINQNRVRAKTSVSPLYII
jgi:hypothetical protein